MVRVLFPGSFDPVTLGHVDLVTRGLRAFESVTVGVAANIGKQPIFTADERIELLRASLPSDDRLTVELVEGLVVDHCRAHGYGAILRGLRNADDLAAEAQLAQMNSRMAPDVETVLLLTAPEHSFVSSSLIKDIVRHGGDVSSFVPEPVAVALRERLGH